MKGDDLQQWMDFIPPFKTGADGFHHLIVDLISPRILAVNSDSNLTLPGVILGTQKSIGSRVKE